MNGIDCLQGEGIVWFMPLQEWYYIKNMKLCGWKVDRTDCKCRINLNDGIAEW